MRLVPNKLTHMSALDVLKAFRTAFESSVGRTPSNSTLAILVAQSCLECGRWQSMHCFNFGNIRPPKNWGGEYCQFHCNEKINGHWVWFDPPSAGSNFVAFDTAEAGATFYMNTLSQHWPEAWTAALNGDTTGFVHGLKQRGFFTADETPYRIAVQKLCTEFFGYMSGGLVNKTQATLLTEYDIPASVAQTIAAPIVIAPALLIGCKGPAVGAWQAKALGFKGAAIDDDFGPLTESATKAWQLQHGLPVTGAVCQPDLDAAGLT